MIVPRRRLLLVGPWLWASPSLAVAQGGLRPPDLAYAHDSRWVLLAGVREGIWPRWYRPLRIILTAGAILALGAAFAAGLRTGFAPY